MRADPDQPAKADGTAWSRFLQFCKTHRPHAQAERFLHRWGALVIVLFALGYYGQYYRSGLNLGGEGGTVAVIAMRLMEGQRPLVDTFLGYNLMWFYPVAWLFELTGPNYIALRLYFFAICTATGVLAFLVVRRVTGRGWFAVLAALGPILIPGMLFRNYMGFLAMVNMLTLLQAYVFVQPTERRRWLWTAAAGLALGLTYLIRIDVAAFFSVITLGLLILYPLGFRGEFRRRAKTALGALGLTVALLAVTHAPFYIDARQRGYDEPFVQQYTGWIKLVRYLAEQQAAALKAPPATPAAPEASPSPAQVAPAAQKDQRDIESEDYLQKKAISDIAAPASFYDRAFILITYGPILVALMLVLPAGVLFLIALFRKQQDLREEMLAILIVTGSALTLFPQYFFFRPDTPHLSEFMVPFLVAMACSVWIVCRLARARGGWRWVWAATLGAVCLLDAGLYFYHSFPKDSAGTIAAKRKQTHELVAENGVRVKLKRQTRDELQQLCDLIKTHTRPGDYVVCYPYAPTINFMTDRPSYEHNLYVDNAHNVSRFHEETMAEITKYRPAAVLIDNRAINQTDDSRFQNWAAETYQWLRENYRSQGIYRKQEVFLRPDLVGNSGPTHGGNE
jgi:hypothetical protein